MIKKRIKQLNRLRYSFFFQDFPLLYACRTNNTDLAFLLLDQKTININIHGSCKVNMKYDYCFFSKKKN